MLALPRLNGRLSLLAAAVLAAPLLTAVPSASAGDVNWRVTVGSHDRGSYQRGHDRGRDQGHRSGYYKSVYRAPVYRTHYDECGRAIRVCVRRGYYERVWVAAAPRRHVSHGSYDHQPRHQRYNRTSRRSNCW